MRKNHIKMRHTIAMANPFFGIKDDLAYFLNLVGNKSLQEAAKKIGISQSALTRSMDRLEDNLGFRILVRTKQGIHLTQQGKEFYQDLKIWSVDWSKIHRKYLAEANTVSGSYTIGCNQSIAIDFVSRILGRTLGKFPDIRIKIHLDTSINIVESINHFQTDFGFVVNPTPLPELVIRKIIPLQIGFYGNGLQKNSLFYNPQMISTEKYLRVVRERFPKILRVIAVPDYEVIGNLVKHEAGYGFLPNHVGARLGLDVISIPEIESFAGQYQLCLVYRNELKRSAGIDQLVEFLISHAKTVD